MPHAIVRNPRDPEAPGRPLNAVATCSVRVADDHVVALFLLEDGHVMLRTRIAASDFRQIFSPGTVGALRKLFAALPDRWQKDAST